LLYISSKDKDKLFEADPRYSKIRVAHGTE